MATVKKAVQSAASSLAGAVSSQASASASKPTPADSLAHTLEYGVERAQDGGKDVLVYIVTLQDNGNPQQGKTVSENRPRYPPPESVVVPPRVTKFRSPALSCPRGRSAYSQTRRC